MTCYVCIMAVYGNSFHTLGGSPGSKVGMFGGHEARPDSQQDTAVK